MLSAAQKTQVLFTLVKFASFQREGIWPENSSPILFSTLFTWVGPSLHWLTESTKGAATSFFLSLFLLLFHCLLPAMHCLHPQHFCAWRPKTSCGCNKRKVEEGSGAIFSHLQCITRWTVSFHSAENMECAIFLSLLFSFTVMTRRVSCTDGDSEWKIASPVN